MQVDALSFSLSPREVEALVMSAPLPEGIRVSDVALKDTGMELTVRAAFLLNLPVRFRVEVQSYAGSRVSFKVAPPIKPNWLVLRPLIASIPGAMYAGHSVVEVDVVSLSKGYLSSVAVQRITLNKSGLRVEATSARSKVNWKDILQKLPF